MVVRGEARKLLYRDRERLRTSEAMDIAADEGYLIKGDAQLVQQIETPDLVFDLEELLEAEYKLEVALPFL